MNLPHVDHVAVLVEDLEVSVSLYQDKLGFYLQEIKLMEDVGIRMAYLQAANIGIELIQYLEPNESNGTSLLAREIMGNQMGYNHIAIKVKDVDAEIESKEAVGFKPHKGFPRQGLHGKVCFFNPETTLGDLMEICEE